MAAKKKDEVAKPAETETDGSLGTDVGYIGERTDPRDDSEHSLESGPDAPSAAEQAGGQAEA